MREYRAASTFLDRYQKHEFASPNGSACPRLSLSLPPNAPPGCRDNRVPWSKGGARHLPVLTFVESLVCCAGGRRSKRLELRKAAPTESPRQLTAVWASVKMTDPCRPVGSKLQCSVRIARLHNAVFPQHRRVRVTSAVFASPPHGSLRIGRCIGHAVVEAMRNRTGRVGAGAG
jgi:hypothetical protein